MTATQVKNAGNVMNLQPQMFAAPKVGSGSDVSFQNILNGQTQKKPEANPEKETGKVKKGEGDQHFQVKNRETSPKTGQVSESPKNEKNVELEENDNTEAMQVLAGTVTKIVDLIAEIFDIPAEELQGIMGEMDLDDFSLLDVQDLAALLLTVGGAKDQTQLLTDEELYGKFNTVMDEVGKLLEAESGIADLNVKEVADIFGKQEAIPFKEEAPAMDPAADEIKTVQTMPEKEPEITVTDFRRKADKTEVRTDQTGQTQNVATDEEGSTLGMKDLAEAQNHRTEDDARREHSGSERGERNHGNPILFDQRPGEITDNAFDQTVSQANGSFSADTQNIMRQIMDYMRVQLRPETTNLEMQLHPASLGTIHIQLQSKGGVVTANFIAQNESVRAALESQVVQLRENMEQQGVKVEAVEVTVQTHQFEQNLEQNNRKQNEMESSAQRTRRVRRLNLNEEATEPQELDEADRIAAEIMEANGNTVDYTA